MEEEPDGQRKQYEYDDGGYQSKSVVRSCIYIYNMTLEVGFIRLKRMKVCGVNCVSDGFL